MRRTLLAAALSALCGAAAAQALTPPMGWNPWNAFHTEVDEGKIMAVADTLVASGLRDAGYRYVNMDDGWWRTRRPDGRIEVRTGMFPSGLLADGSTSLRPFVDRLHALGLKAGIYTEIGRNACSQAWDRHSPNLPEGTTAAREIGTFGHQAADMRLLLGEWGFDYVKVDACGLADFTPNQPWVRDGTHAAFGPWIVRGRPDAANSARVEQLYAGLRREIDAVRPRGDVVLSICTWGEARVAGWAGRYGHTWRTSADIEPTWKSMLHNFDTAAARPLYAGPGRWNDPDMLELGHGEFDARHPVEARAHLSLWAIAAAPLVLGADLTTMPRALLDIAGRREVIAIDQDPAGHQGVTVQRGADTQVLVRTLAAPGHKAVALVNRGARPRRVSVPLARLQMAPGAGARDAWTGQERTLGATLTVDLAPRETALLVLRGDALRPGHVLLTEIPARVRILGDGAAALSTAQAARWVPVQANAAPSGRPLKIGGAAVADGIGVLAGARVAVDLDGGFARFRSRAGTVAGRVPVTYRVLGDGKVLFAHRGTGVVGVDVPVEGVRTLELTTQGPDGKVVEVAWGAAELVR
ncbi:NPCBM/NEW2 domain-containing protein [uncultured Massilia sp.]|uniref:NPCBM/NEW2 domain-containing protein n=1 Tax=uncultured Massilia sp. TaxID=169973 RepID=UPI0025F79C34|nr:NPCBM/NEW2 domain-containing protein [uncultured Massilia sp.]